MLRETRHVAVDTRCRVFLFVQPYFFDMDREGLFGIIPGLIPRRSWVSAGFFAKYIIFFAYVSGNKISSVDQLARDPWTGYAKVVFFVSSLPVESFVYSDSLPCCMSLGIVRSKSPAFGLRK